MNKDKFKTVNEETNQTAKDQLDEMHANACTSGVISAAYTIKQIYNEIPEVTAVAAALSKQVDKMLEGDTRRIEDTLMTQAQTLNALFHQMTRQMASSELLVHMQAYADIALKAQNQCRQTLAVLAELKSPRRTTVIKQQNNAITQQVNNSTSAENVTENKIPANELLSLEKKDETMDFRRAIKTIIANTKLATLE